MAQQLIYHGLVSQHSTLSVDLAVMRQTGFDGLEVSAAKMRDVLAAGFTPAELSARLQEVVIPGIGFLMDIDRHGADQAALMRDADEIFRLAKISGAKAVQVITGPVQVDAVRAFAKGQPWAGYTGLLGMTRVEQIAILAGNLSRLADAAAQFGLLLYLEALAWVPLNRLADQQEVIARADRENLRLAVDFWHCYASGDTPDQVARLDPALLYGVHFCDSRRFDGGIPDEANLRNIATGAGVLNLQDWVDAVKATGYQGWWSCELFCRRQQQDDSFAVATELHDLMTKMIL